MRLQQFHRRYLSVTYFTVFCLQVNEATAEACRVIAPYALQLTDAFDLTDDMISAPIALDWVQYNVGDNQGEVTQPSST